MTDLIEREEWLIRKGGFFYRQNCQGYTTTKAEAGRYTKAKAEKEAAVEPWHMKAVHQDDVPPDSLSARIEFYEQKLAIATDRITALEAEASEGERRGLERAAGVANVIAGNYDVSATAEDLEDWEVFQRREGGHVSRKVAEAIRALIPEASARDGWLPIETAPKNRKILAGYHNPLGNWRTITACYHTHLPWSDEENPEDGSEYAPEGWYEESDTAETIYRTRDDPTHWMPLPAPPQDNREG